MTDDLKRIEKKLDEVLNALPMIYALGSVLVQRQTVINRIGLNKNTLDKNQNVKKFEPLGERKTLIEIRDLTAVKKREK